MAGPLHPAKLTALPARFAAPSAPFVQPLKSTSEFFDSLDSGAFGVLQSEP
jgi:hypothetical protein